MSKKHIFMILGIILSLCIISGGVYLKMKHDEREKQKEIYYKEQQERITLYLKHNTKEANTIKSVHFTSLKQGPMGDAVIKGYINNNKKDDFVAYGSPEDNFQFQGDMIESKKVSNLIKYQTKTPDEIKKELNNNKKDH
ncbi:MULTISPECIES: DUF1433 domain-containing protein [Staphylococcus]|uniref:DUF1433 domain-containing protein n=1 Tax=Staphylococcus TaxID=1279 RepID=UPI0001F15D3F|nr:MULTISPECIES: DUF1433 domain-containing protein [Staphylococcus]ARJ14741.1 hypothetical protein B7468_10505 [Staphylococcus lugdunensis]EFU84204.1 hypothetical protein HMPREF0790_1142 [Staphylococcus lugdunensis M23590]MCH8665715.1 DUF1433 domain-containing protein [Staphylococcus lugdunensis]OFJ65079.1 hypothetical protein HMPREF2855_04865 [Staphylococcus sp. HMSC077E11]OFM47743.1 hypothetical protein HMPREF2688_00575 [Staphylococcus sp. HMSC077E12]